MAFAMTRLMERFNHFISKNKLRHSSQREQVAQVFFETTDHIAVEDLYKKVQKINPKIGIATVYRTLNLLVDSGLAEKRHFDTGATTYEPASEKHHDHLICLSCHNVVEFKNDKIEALQEEVAKKHRYTLKSHKMELYGVCSTCRSSDKRTI